MTDRSEDSTFCGIPISALPVAPRWSDDKTPEAGLQRLEALATVLDQVPDERYCQDIWIDDKQSCGTVACALGWAAAILPEMTGLRTRLGRRYGSVIEHVDEELDSKTGGDEMKIAAAVFGLTTNRAQTLFGDSYDVVYKSDEYGSVSPKEAAKGIRRVVKTRRAELVRAAKKKEEAEA